MKRLAWFSAVVAAFLSLATPSSAQVSSVAQGQATSSISVLSRSALPFVFTSSGSMGNNGALTGITALPNAYPSAYFYLPASAISAGSTAGWYFTQCSTTTACTVFNNVYASGTPVAPSSPTAFATTGPGAFTGATTETVAISITIPGNTMGANGFLRMTTRWITVGASGTSRGWRVRFGGIGGQTCMSGASTSVIYAMQQTTIANRGATNVQLCDSLGGVSGGTYAATNSDTLGAVDSTADIALVTTVQKTTATDHTIMHGYQLEASPSP